MEFQNIIWIQSLASFLFLIFPNIHAVPGALHYHSIHTNAIFIPKADFEVIGGVVPARSHVECASIFSINQNKGRPPCETGFYYNRQDQNCRIGCVPFHVQEMVNGGISVSVLKGKESDGAVARLHAG